jgi:5'-3' exonuclease
MPTVHLVDASFFIFRAFYSIPDHMIDPGGQPVNAVYGFARFISDLLERERPTHVAVAFDESLVSSFRNRLYPPYKANREPAPPALKEQFTRCRELCSCLGLATFSSSEYEADDIIGTISVRMRTAGFASTIITRDKDLAQLVQVNDEFWDYMADERIAYADIADRFGVRPERMADYLALTGDPVDNIPGVPGIGKKTAAALLTRFDSLDHIYEDLSLVDSVAVRGARSLGAKLAEHRDTAYLARELTRIACDIPLLVSESRLRCQPVMLENLNYFYDQAGFGPMLRYQAERISKVSTPTY